MSGQIERTPEGFINHDHYRAIAHHERKIAMATMWSGLAARLRHSLSRRNASASGSTLVESTHGTNTKQPAVVVHEPNLLAMSTH